MMSTRVGIEEAVERATELLAQAEATGDPDAIRAAVMCCSWMAFYRGRCAEARAIAGRLLPDAQQMNPLYRTLVTNSFFSDAYFGALPVQEGFALVEQMRSIMGDSVFGRLRCDMLAAHLSAMAGDDETFQSHVLRSPLVWEELGQPEGRFQFLQATAECARWLGHDDQAEACLRDAKAHLDAQGEVGNNSTVTGELATLVAEGGRIDEAEQLAEEARGMTAPDDFGATVPLNWATSLIASARGDHDAAIAAIDEAAETAGDTDYLSFQADTARIRGRILVAAGRRDEAMDALDEAESMFERKGNVAALGIVRSWRRESAI
jgi:tetratricopeptide (TPR) repeat protein